MNRFSINVVQILLFDSFLKFTKGNFEFFHKYNFIVRQTGRFFYFNMDYNKHIQNNESKLFEGY